MTTITPSTPFDVAALRRAPDPVAALEAVLAEDVEWVEIDQRTPPRTPSVTHGRAAVMAGIRAAHERGIVSRVSDGFAAGDRAALTVTCTYPTGEQVVCNVLADIRDGRIARWVGVQAWDA
jgi:ketosteroid isomerase-like protein